MKWQPTKVNLEDLRVADELCVVLDSHQTYILGRYYNFCKENSRPCELTLETITEMAAQMLRHELRHTTVAEHVDVLRLVAGIQGLHHLEGQLKGLSKRIKFRGRHDRERPRAHISLPQVADLQARMDPEAAANVEMMTKGFRNGDLLDLHGNHLTLQPDGILIRFIGGKTNRSRRRMKVTQIPFTEMSPNLRSRLERCKRKNARFTSLKTRDLSRAIGKEAPRPGVTSYCIRDACFSAVLGKVIDPALGLPDLRRAAIATGHQNPMSLKAYYRRYL